MNTYKVTAVNTRNMPLVQACVFAESESEAADWFYAVTPIYLPDYSGIKVVQLEKAK